MFQDATTQNNRQKLSSEALQNIQFELLNSYIKYSSEQLTIKESEIINQTQLFLDNFTQLHQTHNKSDLTDLCTTQASIDYHCMSEKQSTHRSKDTRAAFKRKTVHTNDRKTKSDQAEALQEIKEVCSQRTIGVAQYLFKEYQKFIQQQSMTDFRQSHVRRKKERCQTCISRQYHLQLRTKQFQEKLFRINLEVQRLQSICKEQRQNIANLIRKEQENVEQNNSFFSSCKLYLSQKEVSLSEKINQLKLIERSICNALQKVADSSGCLRCELVRAIKGQILEYRRFYEREFQKLEKIYLKFKKQLRS